MVNDNTPLLPPPKSDSAPAPDQSFLNASTTAIDDELANHGFTKVAIGVLMGATLGGIAGALATRGVVDRINHTVRSVGDAIKQTAANVNDNVQTVGEAVHSVSAGVNDTVKEVGDAVKGTAEGINNTVKDTVNTVRHTADDVSGTVKDTLDSVKETTQANSPSQEVTTSSSENGTLYRLVPVKPSDSNTDSN